MKQVSKKATKNGVPEVAQRPRRISKRTYPLIKCRKLDCDIIFTPRSKREKYCCEQHRIDQNNDNRDAKAAPGIRLEKMYQHNQIVLKKLKNACEKLNNRCISIDYLNIEDFNHDCFTHATINKETGNTIFWNYSYGLEPYDKNNRTFIIHHRQNF